MLLECEPENQHHVVLIALLESGILSHMSVTSAVLVALSVKTLSLSQKATHNWLMMGDICVPK